MEPSLLSFSAILTSFASLHVNSYFGSGPLSLLDSISSHLTSLFFWLLLSVPPWFTLLAHQLRWSPFRRIRFEIHQAEVLHGRSSSLGQAHDCWHCQIGWLQWRFRLQGHLKVSTIAHAESRTNRNSCDLLEISPRCLLVLPILLSSENT